MAHNLEIIEGKAQMAYVGETPWHGLGTVLPQDVSPKQMQKAAGLDWTVEKRKNFIETKSGERRETGTYSLVRSSDESILTQVGEGWNPVQNDEAFEFFHEFCAAGKMTMHTAGSLKGGRYVWALAKVGSDFELFNGDKTESYLLFSNPHQFGKAIDVRFTAVRTVCMNTLTLALSQDVAHSFRMNHSTKFNPEVVKDALGIAHERMDEFKEAALILGSKQITDAKFRKFINTVTGESKKLDKLTTTGQKIYDLLEVQPGAEFARGSWWQALNAYTYFTDHVQGRSADARITSAWFGSNRQRKIEAMKTALEMAVA